MAVQNIQLNTSVKEKLKYVKFYKSLKLTTSYRKSNLKLPQKVEDK